MAWLGYFALALALLLLTIRSQRTFLSDPPVWPDEALFASPAVDLVQNGTLRARVLEGLLPSAELGAYWVPPGHSFALAAGFALFSIGVETARGLSFACALGVLWLVYGLARRLAVPRALAVLAPALLAIDPVFGRGARVGRMDVMALLLLLAAVYVALDRTGPARRAALLSGALAGLALSVHPIAVIASPIVLAGALWRERPLRAVGWVALGISLGGAGWLAWIASEPRAFVVQWVAQLIRKDASWAAYGASPWSGAFEFVVTRYPPGMQSAWPWLELCALFGLGLAARQQRAARLLLALAVLAWLAVLRGAEMWYTLYLTPFLPLGSLALVGVLRESAVLHRSALAIAVLASTLFVVLAASDAREALSWRPAGLDYATWSARVVASLPRGARVLIAATPDPYFATVTRPDLIVREVLPSGIPLSAQRSDALLRETDFVILGRFVPAPWLLPALEARARLVTTVGRANDVCYGRVFALAR
jgi:hypothetical protein